MFYFLSALHLKPAKSTDAKMSYYLSPWTSQGPELVPRVPQQQQQQQPMLQVPTFQVSTYQPPVGHVPQSVQAQVILPHFAYQQSQ